MSKPEHAPETPATKFLRQNGIAHSNHLYAYEEHGGTKVSARELNVDEHAVIKTLIMEDESAKPLVVLRITLPTATTFGSKDVTIAVDICASAFVHGTTNHRCTGGVSSSPKSVAWISRNRTKKRSTRGFYDKPALSLLPAADCARNSA